MLIHNGSCQLTNPMVITDNYRPLGAGDAPVTIVFPEVSAETLKIFTWLLYGEQLTVSQEMIGMVGDIARIVGVNQERMVGNNDHTNHLTQSG